MGVVVQFDFDAWSQLFPQFVTTTPQFSALTSAQVTGLILPLAEQYTRNDGGGPVNNSGLQTQLLSLMVAHIAQLMFGSSTQAGSSLVGRISNATEGSVSVGADFPSTPNNAWFLQTPFGAMYWQLTAPFRTMRYVPPRRGLLWGRGGFVGRGCLGGF